MSEKMKIGEDLVAEPKSVDLDSTQEGFLEADAECRRQALRAVGANPALAFLLDSIREGVAMVRAEDGHLEWANRAFLDSWRDGFEGLMTRGCRERWKGEVEGCERCPVCRAMQSRKIEEDILHGDDGRIWRVRGIPIVEEGRVSSVFELREDVTDLIRLSDELDHSRSDFRRRLDEQEQETRKLLREREMILDKMTDFAYRHDEGGVFTYLSPSVKSVTGYTVEEWCQHYCQYLTDHPDNDWCVQATERTLRTGERSDPYRAEIFHKNGSRLTLEVNEEPVVEEGHVTGIVGMARDITDRVLAERVRTEAQRTLQLILDTLPLGVFWKDLESRYLGCNQRFARDAGQASAEEVIGLSDFDLAWKDRAEEVRAEDFEIMDCGEPSLDRESAFKIPDGREAWLRMSKIPLRDATGAVTGILGIYEDISSKRSAQNENRNQLLDLLEEKTQNLMEIREQVSRRKRRRGEGVLESAPPPSRREMQEQKLSLRLQGPLDGAIQLIGRKLRGNLPVAEREELQDAFGSAETLLSLLGDLLQSSGDQIGVKNRRHAFNLEALVDEVHGLMRDRAHRCGIELDLDCSSRLPRRVSGDRLRLRQVLLSLIGRAIRGSESSWLRLDVQPDPADADCVIFSLFEGGGGRARSDAAIDEENLLDNQPDTDALIEMMGGILLEEDPRGGDSSIRLKLPLPARDPLHPADSSGSGPGTEMLRRILLVGGGSDGRSAIRDALESASCHVEDTGSFGRGVELARLGLYDAVLLDLDADFEQALRAAGEILEKDRGESGSLLLGLCENPTGELRGSCRERGLREVLDRRFDERVLEKLLGEILSVD